MLEQLTKMIQDAGISYTIGYDERNNYNGVIDESAQNTYHAYIEEFASGTLPFVVPKEDVQKVEVYFFYIPIQSTIDDLTALEREAIRERIKREALFPFVEQVRKTTARKSTINYNYEIPRFECQEIGILVSFELRENICPYTPS